MSKRTSKGIAATAAAIGSAGLILGAPAAGLLAAPGVAQAAPVVPAPLQGIDFGNLFGSGGLGGFDAIFGFFNAIPIVNIFISNGANGTADSPDGKPGGLLFGRGGDGFSPTVPGTNGGNGGSAGFFLGSGGNGGNGAPGLNGSLDGKTTNPVATSTAKDGADGTATTPPGNGADG